MSLAGLECAGAQVWRFTPEQCLLETLDIGFLDGKSFGTNFFKEHLCYRGKQSYKQTEHILRSLYMPVSHPGCHYSL